MSASALPLAPSPELKWLFVRKGLTLNFVGGVMGLVLTLGLSRWMSSLRFGVAPVDPLTYLASATLIGAAAITARYVSARQAALMYTVHRSLRMGAAIFVAMFFALFVSIFLLLIPLIKSGNEWRTAQVRARARRMAEHRMNARLLRLNI